MLKQEFVEAVRAGKIEGLWDQSTEEMLKTFCITFDYRIACNNAHEVDHLCAHLRRWLTSKGHMSGLYVNQLDIYDILDGATIMTFDEGTELDWYIDAALWVLGQEESNG